MSKKNTHLICGRRSGKTTLSLINSFPIPLSEKKRLLKEYYQNYFCGYGYSWNIIDELGVDYELQRNEKRV